MKKITAIIPARMESTRFPGKPLAKICGHTMIEHVLRRVQLAKTLSDVVVATCNEEIVREVERVGGRAVMTKNTHERCTDRIEEAADKVGGDIIVNVQGDEPFVTPEQIDLAVQAMLDDPTLVCSNLMARIDDKESLEDPNEVKVVFDRQNFALYMSREPIPSLKKGGAFDHAWKQVCVIPFTIDLPHLLPAGAHAAGNLRVGGHDAGHRARVQGEDGPLRGDRRERGHRGRPRRRRADDGERPAVPAVVRRMRKVTQQPQEPPERSA